MSFEDEIEKLIPASSDVGISTEEAMLVEWKSV